MRPAFADPAPRDIAERQSRPERRRLVLDQCGVVHAIMEARQRRQGGFDALADHHDRRRRRQPHRPTPGDAAHLLCRLDLGLAGAIPAHKSAMHPDDTALDVLNAADHRRKLATALSVEQRWREAQRRRRWMLDATRPQVDLYQRADRRRPGTEHAASPLDLAPSLVLQFGRRQPQRLGR